MTRAESLRQLQGLLREWESLLRSIYLRKYYDAARPLHDALDDGRWPFSNMMNRHTFRLREIIDHSVDLVSTLPDLDLADSIRTAREQVQSASSAKSYETTSLLLIDASETLEEARTRCRELLREIDSTQPATSTHPASQVFHGPVGMVNTGTTGNIGSIHAGNVEPVSIITNSVQILRTAGAVPVADAFVHLTDAIQGSSSPGPSLPEPTQTEALDLLSELARQAAQSEEQRLGRRGLNAIVTAFVGLISVSADLTELWTSYDVIIRQFLGL